jgi:hypothetical protein
MIISFHIVVNNYCKRLSCRQEISPFVFKGMEMNNSYPSLPQQKEA